jgi:hypothetical protein
MKTAAFILTSALLVVLSGCLIPNENPYYLDDQIVAKPEIIGTWYLPQNPENPEMYEIYSVAENEDGGGYILTFTDTEKQTGTFTMQLAEFDGILIADLTPLVMPDIDLSQSPASALWSLHGHGCVVIRSISEHQLDVRCMATWTTAWDEVLTNSGYDENSGCYKIPTVKIQDLIRENIDDNTVWAELSLMDELPGEDSSPN